MGINRDKPELWENDIQESVKFYNNWFMSFAPEAFKAARTSTFNKVKTAFINTNYLLNISATTLKTNPWILPVLRMSTCPPIASDRLVGLSGASKSLVDNMEDNDNPRVSPKMEENTLNKQLAGISAIITKMIDPDIFVWINEKREPSDIEKQRAATIVADRLCETAADSIIRNAQEKRQLDAITAFLNSKGYKKAEKNVKYSEMKPGTYSFHTNVPVSLPDGSDKKVNIPVDVAIMPISAKNGSMPILIEAKSAGDFTNVNKRRKEEATKMQQLRRTYGKDISYSLFLCGYFDLGYLKYEAAEGIDWIWEHKINDLEKLGI